MSAERVSLANENPAHAGVLSFEESMFNVFSNPEKGDSYGIQLPIKPSDDERLALQGLADGIQSAIDAKGAG